MAELILTQEEIDAQSYLDWDDAALGKAVKEVALMLKDTSEKSDGFKSILAVAAAFTLCGTADDNGAGELELKLGDYEHAGVNRGDWIVTVKKVK